MDDDKERSVYRYTNIAYVLDALARKQLTLLDPKSWTDRNDSLYVDLYRQYRKAGSVLAACFTISNETFHHWHVFGGSSAGACIEYKRSMLETYLDQHRGRGHDIRFEKVKYVTLPKLGTQSTLENLPFLKRWGFQAEKEYRVIVEADDDELSTFNIPVPIAAIRRVVINPWLPDEVVQTLRQRINTMSDCENVVVEHSSLIDNDVWKANGIRMVAGHLRAVDPVYEKLRKRSRRRA